MLLIITANSIKNVAFRLPALQSIVSKQRSIFSVTSTACSKTKLRGVAPVGSLFVFMSKGSSQAKVYVISSMQNRKQATCFIFTMIQLRESVVLVPKFQLSNNQHKEAFLVHSNNRGSRRSDLLFLAFHKENPSPSGATVSLLLQQVNHLS